MHFIFVSVFLLFYFVSHFKCSIFLCYTFSFYLKNYITRCIFFLHLWLKSIFYRSFVDVAMAVCVCSLHSLREWNFSIENDAVHSIRDNFLPSFFSHFCVCIFTNTKPSYCLMKHFFSAHIFNGKICEKFGSHDANLHRKQNLSNT